MNESNENQNQWTEDMTPLGNKKNIPTMEIDGETQQETLSDVEQKVEAEGSAYWKSRFSEAKAEAESVAKYSALIRRMETDPSLVETLERHIAGEAVDQRNGAFYEDDQTEGSEAHGSPAVTQYTEDTVRLAEQRGREIERQQQQFAGFMKTLTETGVPDHMVDKFVRMMNDPSGLTLSDMYAATENMVKREAEGQQPAAAAHKKTEGPSGMPLATASGSTDRPDSDLYKPVMDGFNYIPDANNI